MNGRNAANLKMALIGEWGAAQILDMNPGPLPPSALAARANEWRDGGVDLVGLSGTRMDVKASRPRYPELMIPVKHEAKYRRSTCPVDIFLKATVSGPRVDLTCWEWRVRFLEIAHRDTGQRYPFPTLWLGAEEAHPLSVSTTVPPEVIEGITRFVTEEVPTLPWDGWLTL